MQGLPAKPSIKERLITLFPISKYQIAEFLCYMRKASFYSNYDKRSIGVQLCTIWYNYRFMKKSLKLGFSIGKDVFGYGLLIPHYGTIVVNATARIGNYSVLHTSTCVGGDGIKIGDGLYLSTGAKIMGGT